MNKSIIITILAIIMASLPAVGQVRLGIRGGISIADMRFDRNIVDSDNRVGFNGGLLIDIGIPVVGLGIEASAMYTHRRNRLSDSQHIYKRHYFEFPVYARYRLEIPSVSNYFSPYVFTGPSFSVLFDEDSDDLYSHSRTYLSWDVGGGADLFRHLRLSVTYGIGVTKAMKYIGKDYEREPVNGKDRHWTLSAAYLF